jgi:hypothetical protein
MVGLPLKATVGIEKDLRACIQPVPYRSVPGDNFIFRGSVQQFSACREALFTAHHDFIAKAGHTKSGRPVQGSPYRIFHSPGLVACALRLTT